MQCKLAKIFSFSFPILTHPLPVREKCTVVVGKPLDCQNIKCKNPSDELVTKIHKQYMDDVVELYNKYKEEYGKNIPIEIV